MKVKHLMFSLMKKWLGLGLCSVKNFLYQWYVVIFQNSTCELKIRNKIGIHSQIKKVVHISKPTWKKIFKKLKLVNSIFEAIFQLPHFNQDDFIFTYLKKHNFAVILQERKISLLNV